MDCKIKAVIKLSEEKLEELKGIVLKVCPVMDRLTKKYGRRLEVIFIDVR